jgi:predicted nucleic acid-binding protein
VADRFLLDTSAIFALTDREDGADRVEDLLDRAVAGECALQVCAASLMEVFYVTLQEQGEDEAARLVGLIKSWPVAWIYPDEKAFLQAARFKAFHRLSFADAVIAAVAKLQEATLVHKDPELEPLAGEVSLESLPFKRKR